MATHCGISCLENPKVRGAWQAVVRGVAKSQTPLSLSNSLTTRTLPVGPDFLGGESDLFVGMVT